MRLTIMSEHTEVRGSAPRWGPLFGARAADWAQTWEGPNGWGTSVYDQRARLREDQCRYPRAGLRMRRRALRPDGRGSGRRRGRDRRGAGTGGDRSQPHPGGDFRVGDLEALPWPDDTFDVVTGFSAFQFAQDKVRALVEARRVSRGPLVVVIPHRSGSGIAVVFAPLLPLFPPQALADLADNGIFALSDPGRLDEVWPRPGSRSRTTTRSRLWWASPTPTPHPRPRVHSGRPDPARHRAVRGTGRGPGGARHAPPVHRPGPTGDPPGLVPGRHRPRLR